MSIQVFLVLIRHNRPHKIDYYPSNIIFVDKIEGDEVDDVDQEERDIQHLTSRCFLGIMDVVCFVFRESNNELRAHLV